MFFFLHRRKLSSVVMATPEGQSPKKLERKAAAKEEIVNATSGAREIVDHAAFNARAVGKILLHPFDKEAKAGAIATAREDKAASGQKMAAIRQVGAEQANAMRSMARGEDSPGSSPDSDAGEGDVPSSIPKGTLATDAHTASDTAAEPVSGEAHAPASTPKSSPATDAHTASDTSAEPVPEEADVPASTPKSTPATGTASDKTAEPVSGDHDRV